MNQTEIVIQALRNEDIDGHKIIPNLPKGANIELTLQELFNATGLDASQFQIAKSAINKVSKKWAKESIIRKGKYGQSRYKLANANVTETFDYGDKREKKLINQLFYRKKADNIALLSEPNKQLALKLSNERLVDNARIVQQVMRTI